MGSPRVRRDPATPAKGSGRPASAAKAGQRRSTRRRHRRPRPTPRTTAKTDTEPETGDAIGAPASKRVLRSQGRRTMRKLLDAAMVAFDKRGYHATRVNDIVDIAKTSHGTFYLYFSNKEDLLRALVAEAAGESQSLYDTLNALPVQDAPPQWEDVFGWVQAYSDLWTRYAPLFRVWTDLATADPELVDMVRQTFTAMSGALSKQIGPDSSGHIIDPEAAGMATLAMLDRFHYLREFVGPAHRRHRARDDDHHGLPGPVRPQRLARGAARARLRHRGLGPLLRRHGRRHGRPHRPALRGRLAEPGQDRQGPDLPPPPGRRDPGHRCSWSSTRRPWCWSPRTSARSASRSWWLSSPSRS